MMSNLAENGPGAKLDSLISNLGVASGHAAGFSVLLVLLE